MYATPRLTMRSRRELGRASAYGDIFIVTYGTPEPVQRDPNKAETLMNLTLKEVISQDVCVCGKQCLKHLIQEPRRVIA